MKTKAPKFEDQVRFNWGYHDGAADALNGKAPLWQSPHYDAIYEAGYKAGKKDAQAGAYAENSSAAWAAMAA